MLRAFSAKKLQFRRAFTFWATEKHNFGVDPYEAGAILVRCLVLWKGRDVAGRGCALWQVLWAS